MYAELTDEPLSYQVHIVPNQDGQNNHGAQALSLCVIHERDCYTLHGADECVLIA